MLSQANASPLSLLTAWSQAGPPPAAVAAYPTTPLRTAAQVEAALAAATGKAVAAVAAWAPAG